ncbi:hypothetical protein B0T22DRAFT_531912 [Podospora appendiculata]|uniref:Tat pathway signal sequence n=1 Tax=Podospora appendiculata TaxID=314037 RepID=A0AAE0XFE2_9PEZI|nr:hypothetical protein B0T22DRAFT_531912 [Podospora appendiculata]
MSTRAGSGSANAAYRYTAAEPDSDKDSDPDEHRFPAGTLEPARRRGCQWTVAAPWLLSALFASLSLVLLLVLLLVLRSSAQITDARYYGSYEAGFGTDLVTPSRIPLEQIRFRGSPRFLTSNGTGYLPPVDPAARWPENMDLFGAPSQEVDANWERLIGRRYFSVSEEEAVRAWGEERFRFVDRVEGGLDVFHTLHCLNGIRMALHPEYYRDKIVHRPFHIEHCLDIIRQAIQCHGSTTLIPTEYRPGLRRAYIDSDQTHTCRSFAYLHSFSASRQPGGDGCNGFAEVVVVTARRSTTRKVLMISN